VCLLARNPLQLALLLAEEEAVLVLTVSGLAERLEQVLAAQLTLVAKVEVVVLEVWADHQF
jgi:hypothetical protein